MTKTQALSLKKALEENFDGRAEFQMAGRPGRYRFAVKSKKFDKMPQMKRQDEAWKIVSKVLKPEAILGISLILTFAPRDMATGKIRGHAR